MSRAPHAPKFIWCAAFILVCGWGSPVLHAELTWKEKTIELKADALSSDLTAHFQFANAGTEPVDIGKVVSSCGCTTATLTQRHIEPGQAGEITAQYAVGSRRGEQKKTIAVTTSDRSAPTILTLDIHIPDILRFRPEFVVWKHNEANAPKTLSVEVAEDAPLKDIEVQSSNPRFAAELHPLVEAHKYEITVTPAKTDQSLFATLTVRCHFGSEEKAFRTYATVQPPAPGD